MLTAGGGTSSKNKLELVHTRLQPKPIVLHVSLNENNKTFSFVNFPRSKLFFFSDCFIIILYSLFLLLTLIA